MIPIAVPDIGPEETKAVNEVLESGILAQGPRVAQFEEEFAKYCGSKFAVAINNGTAALHAAVFAAGVKAGDEVITVPFTFIATVNSILMQVARPVLVDIEDDGFNIDVSKVEAVISPKTKAVMPVDLYGQPYDYDQLREIADKHKLKIIEDAAQAVGATYGGKKAGTLGDLSCFSFYATKNIMSGEGGVVTTDDETAARRMRSFRQHGMTAMNNTYEYTELGYNYRMSDLHAAIAIEQLKKADGFNEVRRQNAARFDEGLKGISGLVTPTVQPGRTHVYHQYTIRLTSEFPLSRDDFVEKLKTSGVGAGIYYPKPLHAYAHIAKLGYKMGDFPNAEKAASQVVSLPVHPKLSDSDIEKITSTIRELANV
jgi:dTDP-4-amino-4,6-dideoxygalactose transaminase